MYMYMYECEKHGLYKGETNMESMMMSMISSGCVALGEGGGDLMIGLISPHLQPLLQLAAF